MLRMKLTSCGTRYTMRNTTTPEMVTVTNAGYMSSFLVCAASSACHLSERTNSPSTSASWPVISPERTRCTITSVKMPGSWAMASARVLPFWMRSIRLAATWRSSRLSAPSRRSCRAPISGTPARNSICMWNSRLMSSRVGRLARRNARRRTVEKRINDRPEARSCACRSASCRAVISPLTISPPSLMAR